MEKNGPPVQGGPKIDVLDGNPATGSSSKYVAFSDFARVLTLNNFSTISRRLRKQNITLPELKFSKKAGAE